MSNLYCTGWIPHLNGNLFIKDPWKNDYINSIISGNKKYIYCQNIDDKRDNPIPIDKICSCKNANDQIIIDELIKSSSTAKYFAERRNINDDDKKDEFLFVYEIKDTDTESHLKHIIIFKTMKSDNRKDSFCYDYRLSIAVEKITEKGFVTLTTDKIRSKLITKNNDELNNTKKKLMNEAFIALKDILHIHSHHHNQRAQGRCDEVPDCIIPPVFSNDPLDKNSKVPEKLIQKYKKSMEDHFYLISNLVLRSEKIGWFREKSNRIEDVSITIKMQFGGVILYCRQMLRELKKNEYIDNIKQKETIEFLRNMESSNELFSNLTDKRITGYSARRQNVILYITLFLTIFIAIDAIIKIFEMFH